MKTLRILILLIAIPFFVSATLADAMDQGGFVSRKIQISSVTDDLDLLCDKLKQAPAAVDHPQPGTPSPAFQSVSVRFCVVRTDSGILLPFFLRAPPSA